MYKSRINIHMIIQGKDKYDFELGNRAQIDVNKGNTKSPHIYCLDLNPLTLRAAKSSLAILMISCQ